MIYVFRKYGLSAGRTIDLTTCRSFVLTPASSVQAMVVQLSPRRIAQPTVDSQLNNSAFTETEDEFADLDVNNKFLEQDSERQVKAQKKKLWKILTKKKMEDIPKGPNMLTTSEREHMKYLHNSDPDLWTPEELSKSFPALPYAIRKILKNKWAFEKEEDIKRVDAQVLENWEKFKKNELEAHPAVLRHLKKFVNRQDNLKLQLENPKFFPKPPIPKQIVWKEGNFTKLLTKYEREIKKIQSRVKGGKELVQVGSGGEIAAVNEKKITVIEKIKMEAEKQDETNPEVDSFFIGKLKKNDKAVTLEDMKKNILEKTKTKKPLSKFEELIINKTIPGYTQKTEEMKVERISEFNKAPPTDNNKKVVKTEYNRELLERMLDKPRKEEETDEPTTRFTPWKNEKEETEERLTPDGEIGDDGIIDETRHLSVTDLGRFLYQQEEEEPVVEEKEPKITKRGADTYGTDKDKEYVERDVNLLSGSCFWNSTETPRNKSKDAASIESLSTSNSPHVSHLLKSYFTYDYPDHITIPKEKRKKGKTYRFKDCYYDYDGEFLYRVPGVEMD